MPRFTTTKSFEQIKRSRKLPERSHLGIEFPQKNGRYFRTYIPFLQNPIITERGSSNLIEYDMIGRAGQLFSYGGAKSRTITLDFKINLLHLMYSSANELIDSKFFRQFNLFYADEKRAKKAFRMSPEGDYGKADKALSEAKQAHNQAYTVLTQAEEDHRASKQQYMTGDVRAAGSRMSNTFENLKEAQKRYESSRIEMLKKQSSLNILAGEIGNEFIDSHNDNKPDPELTIGKGFSHAETHRTFYRKALSLATGTKPQEIPGIDDFANEYLIRPINENTSLNLFGENKAATIPSPQEQMNLLNDRINAVYVWVNLVRSTVMNNSSNTTQGPPIVRLTHGPMYNNVPFVVSDYNISMTQEAGYEVGTLTPKELSITMTMREFRTTGSFEQGRIEAGDNLVGWEAIIEDNNIDPYNGAIIPQGAEIESLGTGPFPPVAEGEEVT